MDSPSLSSKLNLFFPLDSAVLHRTPLSEESGDHQHTVPLTHSGRCAWTGRWTKGYSRSGGKERNHTLESRPTDVEDLLPCSLLI